MGRLPKTSILEIWMGAACKKQLQIWELTALPGPSARRSSAVDPRMPRYLLIIMRYLSCFLFGRPLSIDHGADMKKNPVKRISLPTVKFGRGYKVICWLQGDLENVAELVRFIPSRELPLFGLGLPEAPWYPCGTGAAVKTTLIRWDHLTWGITPGL